MYSELYGFSEKPFNLTPDPKFLYLSPSHREALASMVYGITEKRGFICITGEVGTGKTTLIYTLLSNLSEKINTAFIYHTTTSFEQLLKNIFLDLHISIDGEDKTTLLHKLHLYLIKEFNDDKTLAIIIDEAHNLPKDVLEELRMLSNLETAKSKLIQIVLVGQPELDIKLNSDNLRQLKQRITIKRQIKPLSEQESKDYIDHRLKLVGKTSSSVFTSKAIALICQYARGIPRTINILCDNAFLIGYSSSAKKINAQIIDEVIKDKDDSFAENANQSQLVNNTPLNPSKLKISYSYYKTAFIILSLLCFTSLTILGWNYLPSDPYKVITSKYLKYPDLKQSSSNPNLPNKIYNNTTTDQIVANKLNYEVAINNINNNTAPSKPEPAVPAPVQSISTPPDFLTTPKADDNNTAPSKLEPAAPAPVQSISTLADPPTTPKMDDKIITVKWGNSISYLTLKHYHMINATLMDFILKANPEILNAHLIEVNQKIILPDIREESLIISMPDNTYKIHLGTFENPDNIVQYRSDPILINKTFEVVPVKIAPKDTWYRLIIGPFNTKGESLKAIKGLRQKGLLPCFKAASNKKS